VLNATFSNVLAISWRQIVVVEEAGVPGENHRPWDFGLNRKILFSADFFSFFAL
jgi:hypothetical protein